MRIQPELYRKFLYGITLAICLLVQQLAILFPASSREAEGQYPITGETMPGMEAFERKFARLLQRWSIPGAALAIARNGRLVYARGYGWADLEDREVVKPDSLFRVASISKSFTALGVLKLCQDGKLSLDQKAFPLLADLTPCGSAPTFSAGEAAKLKVDPRIEQITIRQLLNMTAGWDRRVSGDPVLSPELADVKHDCSAALRPEAIALIRRVLSRRLDFDPGTRYAYGNFTYVVLGEIIRRVSHQPYRQFIEKEILNPIGLTHTQLGHTLSRAGGEVKYYGFPGEPKGLSLYPNDKVMVPKEYGAGYSLEAAAPSIGWISSAVELLKFVTTISSDRKVPSPLSEKMTYTMLSLPLPVRSYALGEFPGECFAMGWEIDPENTAYNFTLSRHGSLDGTMSYLIRRYDGIAWAVLYNSRPANHLPLRKATNQLILEAVRELKQWPAVDLFERYH
jgi:N-acyl-D-amino-acid deacylase